MTFQVLDSLTGEPIPGVGVALYSQGNELVAGPQSTNNEGRVTFSGLNPGNYSAVITKVPAGYTMDMTTMAVTVEPKPGHRPYFYSYDSGQPDDLR